MTDPSTKKNGSTSEVKRSTTSGERRPGEPIDPMTESNDPPSGQDGPPSDQKGEVSDQTDPFIEHEREAIDQDGEVMQPIETFHEASGSSFSSGRSFQ